MDFWTVLNSPIVLTFVSFLLVGVLASLISAGFQKRAQRHSVKLVLAQEILKNYHSYIRFLRRRDNLDDTDEFSELHAEMLSGAGMAKVVFGEHIAQGLQTVAAKLASVQDLRIQARESGRPKLGRAFNKNLEETYIEARSVIEELFSTLR